MNKLSLSLFFVAVFLGVGTLSSAQASTDRIGGMVGLPTGLSYSHNFTEKDQIDLTLGVFPGFFHVGHQKHYSRVYSVDLALGYLRTVAQPKANGSTCPFEIGAGISFTTVNPYSENVWMTMYLDFRWEIFFASTPKFAMFIDAAPGVGVWLHSDSYAYFAPRGGIGLRAVL